MKREEIIDAISPLNLWGTEQDVGRPRQGYLEDLKMSLGARGAAVAVIGVRRAGKTYLARQMLDLKARQTRKENTLYVLFEDPRLEPYLNARFLEEIYQAYRTYVNKDEEAHLVLDEIQNVASWEKWIRTILERREKARIVVTGSSSRLLSSELATVLTGRTVTLNVFPLDFGEFLSFRGEAAEKPYELISKKEKIKSLLVEYLTYGGFPQVVLQEQPFLKNRLLREIFDGIIYRDVISRHKLKDARLVNVIAELGINNFSSLISASRLRNTLVKLLARKLSPNQVINILGYLEEAFLIFQLPIFSYKIKEQKQYPKKLYCVDPGLVNAVTFRFSENIGRLYENLVAVRLLREKGRENLFYWKSSQGYEVDFVIKEGLNIVQLIQVCYDMRDERTSRREIRALCRAAEDLGCGDLLVLTADLDARERIGRYEINYLPFEKWILDKSRSL